MKTWLDLEKRFREIAPHLRYLRLDLQWGSAGEHYSLTGMKSSPKLREFEELAIFAGEKLNDHLPTESPLKEIFKQTTDPKRIWLLALKELSGDFKPDSPAFQQDESGEVNKPIYFGRIHNVAEVSANLCLKLHREHPIQENRKWLAIIYENYGRQIIIGIIVALVAMFLGLIIK